ncbi:hypothetical protein C2845_PM01G44150 [Panicum miliaceum]|uniref:Uncharacterized protein n=1 Tax=Panicum miliaceum TaxID=4540 RepID=A0A3L6TRB2_PANMI|nr:hypothetical protein C2845_PM01G44150 [Panicum miliaceum]
MDDGEVLTPPMDFHLQTTFHTVAEKIGLAVQEELVMELRPNEYTCKLKISGIPTRYGRQPITEDFYGDFSPFPSKTIDNAYNEVLKRLTTAKMIEINDLSFPFTSKPRKI